MIWTDGQLIPADQLSIPLGDRLCEHGLGLFETFRTWDGRAPLLDRHLARLRTSALALGIDLDPASLPDHAAVERLVMAHELPDALIRLTVSAGRPPLLHPVVWLTAGPLPPPTAWSGWRVVDAPWPVAIDDRLARHKTLNYWAKRMAHEYALSLGADEAIIRSPDGRIWEGSRTSLFVRQDRLLLTPPATGPIVAGVLRQVVIELADASGYVVREGEITDATIRAADEVFLTNSVRGLITVVEWSGRDYHGSRPSIPTMSTFRQRIAAFCSGQGT